MPRPRGKQDDDSTSETRFEGGSLAKAEFSQSEDHGNTVTRIFEDGSTRFLAPFSKEEAEYVSPNDPDFDHTHDRCAECVHWIPGGGCHFVQGEIDAAAYCAQFFADYGVFAHEHENHVEVNSELVGSAWDFDESDIQDFVDEIEERLEQRLREKEEQ